jgi:hypothetical protein
VQLVPACDHGPEPAGEIRGPVNHKPRGRAETLRPRREKNRPGIVIE